MPRQQSRFEQLASGLLTSQTVSIDEISFENFPRRCLESSTIETLARAVAETGIRTPISVFFRIGESIPFACDGLELRIAVDFAREKQWILEDKPVLVRIKLESDRTEQTNAYFERLQDKRGKSLSLLERADCIDRLIELGHSPKGLALALHTSKAYIMRLLELSKATPETRRLIDQKKLTATTVMNAIAKYGSSQAEKLLKASVDAADNKGTKATGEFVAAFIDSYSKSDPPFTGPEAIAPISADPNREGLLQCLREAGYSELTPESVSKVVEVLENSTVQFAYQVGEER